jgi:hypothetical protein
VDQQSKNVRLEYHLIAKPIGRLQKTPDIEQAIYVAASQNRLREFVRGLVNGTRLPSGRELIAAAVAAGVDEHDLLNALKREAYEYLIPDELNRAKTCNIPKPPALFVGDKLLPATDENTIRTAIGSVH